MTQTCPMCGHRSIDVAILRHIGDAEMRIDRGHSSVEELTTSYMIKAFGCSPGVCYQHVRELVIGGMLEELPKQHIRPHMVVPTYRLTDAGLAYWRNLRAWDEQCAKSGAIEVGGR